MKILYLAFACNPYAGSEAQCGWSWPMAMRKYSEVYVITRTENREPIERFKNENKIENIHMFYYDIPSWMNVYYKTGKMYHQYYILWQKSVVAFVKRLQEQYNFDYIHHITLGDFRSIGAYYNLKAKFIFGPVGGAQLTPKVFKEYIQKDKKSEVIREMINHLVGMMPYYRKALNGAKLVLSANKETQIFLQQRMKFPEHCKLLTENGISKDKLQGIPKHCDNKIVTLLWAGRMVKRKGLSFLLDILNELKTEIPYRLMLVGDGPELSNLNKQAEQLGISDKVQFTGKIPHEQMQMIYRKSDFFVFPSLRETTGTVLFEAMSFGLPVITFNQNGADMLIDETCGRKINIHQELNVIKHDFAASIKELVDNPSLCRQLGKCAYERMEREYTWEEKCERFVNELM